MPLLETHGLTGPRGTTRVQDATLTVERHEIVHVIGPSGSGKTSLLRLLSRLDPLDRGTLSLDGLASHQVPLNEWRRRVALVFQEPRLFPGTVEANLRWGAAHHGYPVDPQALLRAVGGDIPLDREASVLSGGEAKRVQLARSLAVRPDTLLLDEPTGSLDPDNRHHIRDLIRRLSEDGYGIIVVSHLSEDQDDLPARTMRLEHGRLEVHL